LQIHKLFIGVAMFSLFMVAGITLFGEITGKYYPEVQNYSGMNMSKYDLYNDLSDDMDDAKSSTYDEDLEGEDETADSIIKGGYKALKKTPQTIKFANDMIQGVGQSTGIVPDYFMNYAYLMLVIGVVFAGIYLIFKFKG